MAKGVDNAGTGVRGGGGRGGGVRRGEARAIEQALINRNPGFENIRNSISPNHSWYGEAVEWGEAWLRGAGY